jgi:hypothetical protein
MPNNYGYINIASFLSETRFEDDEYYTYDLREPIAKITNPEAKRRTTNVNTTTEDWGNISYYPTLQDRKDAAAMRRQSQQQPQPHPPRIQPSQPVYLRQPQPPANIFSQNYTNKVHVKGGGGGHLQSTNTHLGVARR